uniref:Uncharacterized protein MGC4771 n=1 Tax=Homo sapiens TaxID=9606 RepID=Q53S20_HUMAN|nr:unknown [Homo sapiens]
MAPSPQRGFAELSTQSPGGEEARSAGRHSVSSTR